MLRPDPQPNHPFPPCFPMSSTTQQLYSHHRKTIRSDPTTTPNNNKKQPTITTMTSHTSFSSAKHRRMFYSNRKPWQTSSHHALKPTDLADRAQILVHGASSRRGYSNSDLRIILSYLLYLFIFFNNR